MKKYNIAADRKHLINMDDGLADRVWQAAVEFLADTGVFHQDTGRVIQFSKKEIEK